MINQPTSIATPTRADPLSKRQLLAMLPLLLILLVVFLALAWFVTHENRNFYRTQQALAQSAGTGVAHNIEQLIMLKQRAINNLLKHAPDLLRHLGQNPADPAAVEHLQQEIELHINGQRGFLLTNGSGKNTITSDALDDASWLQDVLSRYTASPGHPENWLVLDSDSNGADRFSIIEKLLLDSKHYLLLVSFDTTKLRRQLSQAQVPGLSTHLVRADNPARIEIPGRAEQTDSPPQTLSIAALDSVLYQQHVNGSGWKIIVLPKNGLFDDYWNQLIQRSSLVFAVIALILFFVLRHILSEERSRAHAEAALNRSHRLLEERVAARTAQLAQNEENLRNTFMSAPYGMMVVNQHGKIESINRLGADIFQYSQQHLVGQPVEILLPQRLREKHVLQQKDFFTRPTTRTMGKGRYLLGQRKNGEEFPIEVGLSRLTTSGGEKIIASVSDVSEITRLQQQLRQQHELALVTLSSIGDGVITTDVNGQINHINPVAEKLCGWKSLDAINRPIDDVFHIVDEKTRIKVDNPVMRCLREQAISEPESPTLLIHRGGMDIPVETNAAPIRNGEGNIVGAVLVFHDVSQSRAHANEIEYQANHDALTGLLNRREFDNRLINAVEQARNKSTENVLLFMDLDRFKRVNDTAGHAAGDELLVQLTSLMASRLRQRDTLARLGGDEFAVLLEHCDEKTGLQVANKLRCAVEDFRFYSEDQVFSVGLSVGMVSFSTDAESADELLSEADAACYTAKEGGRNRVQVYDAYAASKRGESSIINLLEDAFENDRMLLYQQRIKSARPDDKTLHCEILVRMRSEQGSVVAPGMFLPAAERFGLATTLDRWVVRSTLRWMQQHQAELQQSLSLAINLSAQSITDSTFAKFIEQQFAEYRVRKESICFEITETAAMKNLQNAHKFITDLKALGCRFALDDFGSGHASYAHLKNLPVDYLKIDGLFVKDIPHDPINLSIVKSVNDISHALGLETIAEYVENNEICQTLIELGVNYLQGYGIARPAPMDELLGKQQPTISAP